MHRTGRIFTIFFLFAMIFATVTMAYSGTHVHFKKTEITKKSESEESSDDENETESGSDDDLQADHNRQYRTGLSEASIKYACKDFVFLSADGGYVAPPPRC